DLLAGLIDDEAVIRYDDKMAAEAEEAADLEYRETELFLVLVRDHIVDGPDLFVLVVDHGGADQLAHPIALRHDRKIDLDELHSCLRQCRTGSEGDRKCGADHPA